MSKVKFFYEADLPLEMHKVRIVQKLNLKPIERRLKAIREAGNNTFLLKNRDVFLDMLTDSGVNAMSDLQLAAMMRADDSYAGSETFTRLENKIKEIFGKEFFLPTHQGRACENIIAQVFVTQGSFVPMNYHFTTTKAHITLNGGEIIEIPIAEAWQLTSEHPFKGNMDVGQLQAIIEEKGVEKIAFVRMEAGANLIGGQPFSLANLRQVKEICKSYGLLLVLDASLLADNLYFIKQREVECRDLSIGEIVKEIAGLSEIIYFSARKLGCARGGVICTNHLAAFEKMRELIPLYEGFLTYGGMSVREMEAIAVGLEETLDEEMIKQGPEFIAYMTGELQKRGVPVVTPPGGLGCHINARDFLPHLPQEEYPAGALAAAYYLVSGVRGMERGTLSEQRDAAGNEPLAAVELLRLALPRRVFTLSQVKYAIDRLTWLYEQRNLVGGLEFVEEPRILRFFFGRLRPISAWQEEIVARFREDFGESL
ncbi:MAG TPA: tryptophanase [Clostridia bacterium]|nr:tryptophanase [Clostridia bacterium]